MKKKYKISSLHVDDRDFKISKSVYKNNIEVFNSMQIIFICSKLLRKNLFLGKTSKSLNGDLNIFAYQKQLIWLNFQAVNFNYKK